MKKRILSILLALCLMLGLCSVGVAAETAETAVLVLNGGPLVITHNSYTYGAEGITVPFTGNYIIGGTVSRVILEGGDELTFNVVVHQLDIYAGQEAAFQFNNSNTTLNLSVYGRLLINSEGGIATCAQGAVGNRIVADFAVGSWLNGYLPNVNDQYLGEGVSFTDENGTPFVNESDSENYFFIFESDQRVEHQNTVVKGENGCEFICGQCDLIDGMSAPHTPGGYRLVSDIACGQCCAVCDDIYISYEHDWKYTPAEGGHTVSCGNCKAEFEGVWSHTSRNAWIDENTCGVACRDCGARLDSEGTEHSYENNNYHCFGDEGCAPMCDVCQGHSETPQPHDFSQYYAYDDQNCYAVCSHCFYTQVDEDDNPVLIPHEFGDAVTVPATDEEAEYTESVCERCGEKKVEYNKENCIFIDMPTYYYPEDDSIHDEMGGVIVYRNGELWRHVSNESYDQNALPFDPAASYVFKVLPTLTPETSLTIWLPDMEKPVFHSDNLLEDGYGMYDTLYAYNLADYTQLQAELDKIPDNMSICTEQTALAVADAVKGVKRMLPASRQKDVDAMTVAVKKAVENLQERGETDPAHGVVHLKNTTVCIEPEKYEMYTGDTWEFLYDAYYEGDYVVFGSGATDLPRDEEYSIGAFWTYGVENLKIDLVNVWSIGDYADAGLYESSSVTLTLFGNNVIADGNTQLEEIEEYAGITVQEGNAITIGGTGSLLALGQDNCAGIGGSNGVDDTEGDDAGTITVNGGTVFALSAGDAAGIGGGYKGAAGNIIINGGTIYATCLHDDGPGIGTGEDGVGGSITINGGRITAVSYDDDGAGIGSGDKGHCDEIIINGGVVIAGSDDGAAIGGGSDIEGYGGKITINGGLIMPHKWHDEDEWFIGNGNESSDGLSDDNFVLIKGGVVVTTGTDGIYPLVLDENNPEFTLMDIAALKGDNHFRIAAEYGTATLYPVEGAVEAFTSKDYYTYVGDVDGDGTIGAADALEVLKMIVGKCVSTKLQKYSADVDADGITKANDALEILKFVVGKPSVL